MGMPRDGCRSTGGLFSVSACSPALNPWNVSSQSLAEIDGSLIEGQPCGCCPKVDVVAVAVTAMAVVAAERHVDGEGTTPLGRCLVQGTRAIPLPARSSRRLEAEQAEHLLHRDLGTQSLEVDA